jgi:hypothetical protein
MPDEMGRACNMHAKEVLIKPWYQTLKERDPLTKSTRRWQDNIKIDFKETG